MDDFLSRYRLPDLLAKVVSLSKVAGGAVMTIYNTGDVSSGKKADASPLTAADIASHQIIVEGLTALTPEWPVLSEESSEMPFSTRRSWNYHWLVDPLDGTKEFIARSGEFTVNIALIERGFPVLGVIYAPAVKKLYYGAKGSGAFMVVNGDTSVLQVSKYERGRLKLVASRSHGGESLNDFLKKIGDYELVSMGSSLKFCMVAEGTANLYPRLSPTMEWDTAAAQCIVEEAGGFVTDGEGMRLGYNKESLLTSRCLAAGQFGPGQPGAIINLLRQGK